MFSITSAEVRWFIKGKIPSNIFDWFIGLNENYVNQPERIDQYLLLKSNDSLGIKLREGRVEIKQRESKIGNLTPGNNVTGLAEKWQKWSFEIKETNQHLPEAFNHNKWTPVSKKRIIVNYGISENNIVTQKEKTTYKNGCLTELTSLQLYDDDWWTLGLEAYGEENRLVDNLILISHLLLNDKSDLMLSLENSMSYPGWLTIN